MSSSCTGGSSSAQHSATRASFVSIAGLTVVVLDVATHFAEEDALFHKLRVDGATHLVAVDVASAAVHHFHFSDGNCGQFRSITFH